MGCTVCSYKQTCLSEMEAYDNGHGHVTLLAGVTPITVENHFPQVSSIKELATTTPLNDAMIQAQIRARVWQTGLPELLNPAEPFEIQIGRAHV